MENRWYDLDPDHNKEDPKYGLFCCRCKKPIKETMRVESFISVEMHPTNYWVKPSIKGRFLIGSECAKKLIPIAYERV